MGLRDRRHEKSKTTIVSEKCIAGCAEAHSQGISHLKLHREPKQTCSVEVLLACFNISLKVSGTQTQVSVSNKQTSEFALAQPEARASFFHIFAIVTVDYVNQTLFTQPDKTTLLISRHYGSIHVHCDL